MTNRLLGEDRMIVDARAGTTRDAVDSALAIGDRRYVLVDTAGLRRSRGIDRESTEGLSVIRTLRAVERCHVAVLLLDATEGVTDQDARIAGHIEDKGRGLVIVLNKWDAVEKDPKTAKAFADQIELKMPFVQFAPVIFLSGLTGLRVPRLLEQVDRVRAAQRQRIATGPLNRWLEQCQRRHAPPVAGIRRVRLYFATQVAVEPPTIMISCNHPDNVHFSYKRYLINQFREAFDVVGTPVRIVFRARGESSGRANEDEEGVETEGDEEVALTADDEGDSEDVGVESDDEGVAEGDDGEEPEDDAADDADPEDAAADDDRA
jgi:GTP-binding protein